MKKILFPKIIGRFDFFIFSIIAFFILCLCSLSPDLFVLGFVGLIPIYIAYMIARIRDGHGKLIWWVLSFGIFLLMTLTGIVENDEAQVYVGITLLIMLHLGLQFKKGHISSVHCLRIKSNFGDAVELWNLKREVLRINRRAEIEKLRKEVENRPD